jgi:CRISPR-associated protein Csd1
VLVVFWSDTSNPLESNFTALLEGEVNPLDQWFDEDGDHPDADTEAVRELFQSVHRGHWQDHEQLNHSFYILGLAPNSARIVVRFWKKEPVGRVAENLLQHFRDLRLQYGEHKPSLGIHHLLLATAVRHKSENIPPNLAGETLRAILEGTPYPRTLLSGTLNRLRSGEQVNAVRAGLLKAVINRFERYYHHQEEELKVSLDRQNTHPAYILGRLFAVLERIQEEAQPGINTTIRERYYASASGTPAAVFSILLRLKNHHLAKLNNPGRRIYFEKLLGEILAPLQEIPRTLDLMDQGRFAVGYYHQRQDFFTPKTSDREEPAAAPLSGNLENN